MKIKHKKLVASGTAIALAGVMGVGALLQTSVSVQASSVMMPGIEQIVNDTTADEPFRILEIVDNKAEAEIGYYVSGQEPYIKLYTYKYTDNNNQEKEKKFQTLKEGLEELPSSALRKGFAMNVSVDEKTGEVSDTSTGIKNIQDISYQEGASGDSVKDYPLSYSAYEEKYFLSDEEQASEKWTEIKFKDIETGKSRIDTVKVRGEYQENPAGSGNYTKQEQVYYPIRQDSDDESRTDKYRENIQNFYYADDGQADAPYFLEFEEVDNASVNEAFDENHNKKNGNSLLSDYDYTQGKYGYYENVYNDLTKEIVDNITTGNYTFPGENPQIDTDSAVPVPDKKNDQSTNAKEFSDNTEDFSSTNENNLAKDEKTEQPDVSSDSAQPVPASTDAFSADEFSDGDAAFESTDVAQVQDNNGSDVGETNDDFNVDSNSETADATFQSASAQTATIKNDEIQPIILYTQSTEGDVTKIDPTVGTSANPKVYYGKTIDQYPYYQYTLLSDMRKIIACANKNAEAVENGTYEPVSASTPEDLEKNITFQDGQYWYWTINEKGNIEKNPILVVTQRQPVSYDDIRELPESLQYNYYYKVKQAYFCCKKDNNTENDHAFIYYGWYFASYPKNEDAYIKVIDGDGKVPTHYISEAEYKYTAGIGNYDFITDNNMPENTVEVDHMYYHGGYVNNDWFKRYVFHLNPDTGSTDEEKKKLKKQMDSFNIQVDTITAEDFNAEYGNGTPDSESEDTESATVDSASEIDSFESDTDGEVAEVDPMVSEAGVELVSIENEISDEKESGTTSEFEDGETTDFQDGSDTESQNVKVDESEVFSAGAATQTDNPLSKYGLVYVNGNINIAGFQAIYNSAHISESIPCIVNADKLEKSDESSGLRQAVSGVKVDSDEDGHYVNTCVYFFKNTFQNERSGDLINTDFYRKLNPTEEITDSATDPLEGFEEILNYIKLENKYRSIGETQDGNFNDGRKIDPLSDEISQARAIEYIINYKYKRKINTKTSLNVLEIEPYFCNAQVDQAKVIKWLDGTDENTIESATACCWHNGEEPGKAFDGNSGSMWHSAYKWENTNFEKCHFNDIVTDDSSWDDKNAHAENSAQSKHWIEFTLKETADIDGFEYVARQDNSTNGNLQMYSIYLTDEKGNPCLTDESGNPKSISGNTGINSNAKNPSKKTINFPETVKNVKKIKLTFVTTPEGKYAACAEFGLIVNNDSQNSKEVTVKSMTAAEFVGHIDDIASEYDMIYVGDGTNGNANNENGNTLLTGPDGKLYSHVGDVVSVKNGLNKNESNSKLSKLLGQLDNEFDLSWKGDSNYTKRFAPVSTYRIDGAGYLRGSGNDMTRQECDELINFVKSGYPVVLGNALVDGERSVNTAKVDAASYYYQFIDTALNYPNVITSSEATQDGKLSLFYVDLAKPVIKFAENNGRPPEPRRLNEEFQSGQGSLQNHEIKYTFTIENDSDSAPASSTYDCKLYFDLNFDGNLSDKEVQDKYMTIEDSKGNVLSQVSYGKDDLRYQLKIGEQYTVTRKIPSDYYKLITWKLVVTNNDNTYIHTSEIGYSKQDIPDRTEKQNIKVLQILPDYGRDNYTGKWDLAADLMPNSKKKVLKEALAAVQDFNITIEPITVSNYVDKSDCTNAEEYLNYLKKFQILIIGFDDVYPDISNNKGQVDAIREYIKSGRSIIFSHDTTSYLSYTYGTVKGQNSPSGTRFSDVYPKIAPESYETGNEDDFYSIYYDNFLSAQGGDGKYQNSTNFPYNPSWGISLNNILRSIVGMDRYGITLDDKNISDGLSISALLKRGHELNSDTTNFDTLLKNAGDIAYKSGNGSRSSSYAQTQAFTNAMLRQINLGSQATTTTATKLNDGAITQYPYRIGAQGGGTVSDSITVARTHGQYFQLALEKDMDINGNSDGKTDIVVWYCLSGNAGNVYSASPNDARNCYYYYSNGNVIYTGTGHSSLDENTNKDEIYLFVNSIVAAANVTAVNPYVDFVKELNPAAQKETTRYYATDQAKWSTDDNANVLNDTMDFYVNIKDYNMVSAGLSEEDKKAEDMIVNFYIGDSENKVLINSRIAQMIPYGEGKNNITLSSDGQFHLGNTSNNAYKITVPNIEQYLRSSIGNTYKNNCKLFVEVTSKVSLYGEIKTNSSTTELNLKQRQLFDLD